MSQKVIKISLSTVDGSDASLPVYVEGRQPGQVDSYVRVEAKDLVANKDDLSFTLKKGERLVIGDMKDPEVVFDPAQNASVLVKNQRNEEGRADDVRERTEDDRNTLARIEKEEKGREEANRQGVQNPKPGGNPQSSSSGMKSSSDVKGK